MQNQQDSRNTPVKLGCVLLADRHQNMLEGIRTLLEKVFDVVVMVADEKSLLDSLEKVKPDLVIADLSLQITEDHNITGRIRKCRPDAKIIILSVYDDQIAVEDCFSEGASGYVLKQTTSDDLIPAVREVLNGRTYVSPSVEMEG